MLEKVDFYYFSPTGGTKKVGEVFAGEVARTVCPWDLGKKETRKNEAELLVVAVPVFGGRIPGVAAQRLRKLDGQGKRAVTLVVYGTRAYEDALLELNDVITDCGFQIVASGAFVAQHSMAPQVGSGRPDGADKEELRAFAGRVLKKVENGQAGKVEVPTDPISHRCRCRRHPSVCHPVRDAEPALPFVLQRQLGSARILFRPKQKNVSCVWPVQRPAPKMPGYCRHLCRRLWSRSLVH